MIQGDRINRLAQLFGGNDADEMYRKTMLLSELQLSPEPNVSDGGKSPPLNELLSDFIVRDMIGYLPGAHDETCPVYTRIAKLKPAWMKAERLKG